MDGVIIIRKAKVADIGAISRLIKFYAKRGKLLKRTKPDIKKNIRSFFVALSDEHVVGCAYLDIYSRKMCEIRSLAVKEGETHRGIGKLLVKQCIESARKRKVREVMVITSSSENFFKQSGFNYTLPGERKALFFNP